MDIKAPDFSDAFKKEEAVVGIMGMGLVGQALKFYFDRHGFPVIPYDRYHEKEFSGLEDLVKQAQVIFVAVPAPVREDRTRNMGPIWDALESIEKKAAEIGRPFDSFIACIISPTNPGYTKKVQEELPGMRITYMPEFLTNKNANFDLVSSNRFVVGGSMDDARVVLQFFLEADRRRVESGKCVLVQCDATAAELSRLLTNGALLSKAFFSKQVHDIAAFLGVDFEETRVLACLDPRVGPAFTKVEDTNEREVNEDFVLVSALDDRQKNWPGG